MQQLADKFLSTDTKRKVVTIIATCVVGGPVVYYVYKKLRIKLLHLPNGPVSPFGSISSIRKNPKKFFKKMGDKYGAISSFVFGDDTIIILNNSNLIRLLWSKPAFIDRQPLHFSYYNTNGSTAKMFVSLSGDQWLHRRKLASNTLFKILTNEFIEEIAENVLNKHIYSQINNNLNGQVWYPGKILQFYTFDTMAQATLGKQFILKPDDAVFTTTTSLIDDFFFALQPYLFMNFFPLLNKFSSYYNNKEIERIFTAIYNTVADIAVSYKTNSYKPNQINNYLDMIIKAIEDKEIALDEAVMDAVQFFGTGTVAAALIMHMGILYAAQNPNIQTLVHEELVKASNKKNFIDINSISQCPLFNAFVYETLRMTCPVPVPFAHKCTETTTVNDPHNPNISYNIPKDSLVLANMYYVHRESKEDWGDDCDKFDVQRWLKYTNNSVSLNDKHKKILIFSYGGRVCIGKNVALKQIQLILANLFLNYEFYFDDNDKLKTMDLDEMRTFNGFYWKFTERVGVKVNKRQ